MSLKEISKLKETVKNIFAAFKQYKNTLLRIKMYTLKVLIIENIWKLQDYS